jgi:hypothetical protein
MQEIFENMLKDAYDQMIKDRDEIVASQNEMIMNTDVVALLKHVKLQRALAENHRMGVERQLKEFLIRTPDASDECVEDELVREACDFSRIVETMDWFIDMIEAGKFAKEV